MSLINKISENTSVSVLPGSKRKHLIFHGSMTEGTPRIWDAVSDAWVYVRPLIFARYGIEQVRKHTMPSCGRAECISPACLREGQTMSLDQIPKPIQSADIFSLAQSGAFFDVANNLGSLSISRASWRMTPTGETPRFTGQRIEQSQGLFA